MPEVAPALGIAPAPTVGARISGSLAGDRPAARQPPPRPPPQPPPSPPSAPSAHPGVEVARAGLLLEALVRPRAPGADGFVGPALRGIARVVPLVATAGGGTPAAPAPAAAALWLEGERLATVLGPAGADGLFAEADGFVILLRGARLHLPPGARLRIAWEGHPVAVEQHPGKADGAAATPRTAPVNPATVSAEPPAPAGERGPDSRAESRGPPAPAEGALVPSARAAAEPATLLVEEGVGRLGASLGLAVAPVDEQEERDRRDGRDRTGREPEAGRSVFLLELPELGRVRLTLVWSRQGVELAVAGLPKLVGEDRAAFLKAFEAALAASGARGRAVLVTAPAERAATGTPADPHRDGPEGSGVRPQAAGEGP